jgi:hypothetical protein
MVVMKCGGEVCSRTTVGVNGHFSLQVNAGDQSRQLIPDAGRGLDQTAGGLDPLERTNTPAIADPAWDRRSVLGCELQALLHSYSSTVISLREQPAPGLNNIGTIVVYPYARMQGFSVSLATLMAPKAARNSLEQAQRALQNKRFDDAERFLRSAVREYPRYPEALFLLGEVCERSNRAEEARGLYYSAIKADPMNANPYLRLAKLAAMGKRWREAADLSEELLKLDPVALLDCYFINALAHLNLNELDLADRRAAEAQRMDFSNQFPQFCLIRASVFAQRQDSAAAVRELQQYLQIAPHASNAMAVRAHIHELEQPPRTAVR